LKGYFEAEEVECFVIGEPFHLNGDVGQMAPQINTFIEQLKKMFPEIPIHRQDERFTSVEAKRIILKSGAKKKKRRDKALVDKISAVLILQEYMERQR